MKILVTGGAGFIGSAVVRTAIARGYSIVNLDALNYAANLANVAPVADNPRYSFVQADIRDRAALDEAFATHRPDIVLHLAAESHVDRSIDGPADFIDTNITGTFNMLEAARNTGRRRGGPMGFAFITSRRMRCSARYPQTRPYSSLKPQRMTRAARIRPQRPRPIIWCVRGTRPMDCPWCSEIAPTITDRINFRKS